MKTEAYKNLFLALQAEGHRLTKLRLALIEIFALKHQPLLLEDLQIQLLQRGLKMHRVTVYREIEFLINKQIIVAVILPDGKSRYEFAKRKHHHHLVCTSCQKIQEVEFDDGLNSQEPKIAKQHNFLISRHALEFFGVCAECR